MGKYSKSMRAWSEKQLAQFICRVFDEEIKRYTGPTGAPGVQGPQGAPGTCQCHCIQPYYPYLSPPIVSFDGTDTKSSVIYEDLPLMQSVPYTCGCSWVGLAEEVAPKSCPGHPMSGEKK